MSQEQPDQSPAAAEAAQQPDAAEDQPSAEQRLLAAAAAGDGPLVVQLLHAGAEPACETEDGVTPLMLAAESGSAEAVQALLGEPRMGLFGLCCCLLLHRRCRPASLTCTLARSCHYNLHSSRVLPKAHHRIPQIVPSSRPLRCPSCPAEAGAPWHAQDKDGHTAGEYASGARQRHILQQLLDWAVRAELLLGELRRSAPGLPAVWCPVQPPTCSAQL